MESKLDRVPDRKLVRERIVILPSREFHLGPLKPLPSAQFIKAVGAEFEALVGCNEERVGARTDRVLIVRPEVDNLLAAEGAEQRLRVEGVDLHPLDLLSGSDSFAHAATLK